jgi:hypothetical protein
MNRRSVLSGEHSAWNDMYPTTEKQFRFTSDEPIDTRFVAYGVDRFN